MSATTRQVSLNLQGWPARLPPWTAALPQWPRSQLRPTSFLLTCTPHCHPTAPPGIRDRPVLTAAKNPFVDSQQMHDAVCATLATGEGLYALDRDLLVSLAPDLVVTQSLCK